MFTLKLKIKIGEEELTWTPEESGQVAWKDLSKDLTRKIVEAAAEELLSIIEDTRAEKRQVERRART